MKLISFEAAHARRSAGRDEDANLADELPELGDVLPSSVRRPGELHEFVPLDPLIGQQIAQHAAEVGLKPDVAATIALEALIAVSWLDDHGVKNAAAMLSEFASQSVVTRGLSAADANYIRSITAERGRAQTSKTSPHSIALPVRLMNKFSAEVLAEALRDIDISAAVQWEIASLMDGRSLAEWAFAVALAERASGRVL